MTSVQKMVVHHSRCAGSRIGAALVRDDTRGWDTPNIAAHVAIQRPGDQIARPHPTTVNRPPTDRCHRHLQPTTFVTPASEPGGQSGVDPILFAMPLWMPDQARHDIGAEDDGASLVVCWIPDLRCAGPG
ncbi:hypothetical protein [Pseudovibrio exalbescens]|uniref:hypothetical protein n=1 Tax=Pseudovibrio exalbescens TaxID=197461 RepID=UPI000C9AB45C|nr:hypothetical protein [Pseudovibrio exalbescens]